MNDKRPGVALRNLSLPALLFTTAGLWTVFQLVFRIGSLNLITIITTVIGGLFFGAVMTVLVAVNRRRLGGPQQVTDFTAALRTGTPPPDADTAMWRAELDRLDRTRTRTALIAVGCSALPIALGIWALFDPDARLLAVVLLIVFLGLDAAVLLALPGQRRRANRLRQHLNPTSTTPYWPMEWRWHGRRAPPRQIAVTEEPVPSGRQTAHTAEVTHPVLGWLLVIALAVLTIAIGLGERQAALKAGRRPRTALYFLCASFGAFAVIGSASLILTST